jgi:hypothetical protein
VLVDRELAELIAGVSPRDFFVREVMALTVDTPMPVPYVPSPDSAVPAGAVSEIFVATMLPPAGTTASSSAAARRARRAREALERSKGLVSASALTMLAQDFFDAGDVDQAVHLWRQAADHGDVDAAAILDRLGRTASP